jgi:Iap family predicted aminopeptidase
MGAILKPITHLFAIALVALTSWAQTTHDGVVTPQQIEQRLRSAPESNEDRQQAIAQMFREVGCAPEQLELRPLRHSKFSNVVCTVPGSTGPVIIAGAHFDHTKEGDGIIDNWSGASMIADVMQRLLSEPRRHTFVFVAFAGEEDGLLGSRDFVSRAGKEEAANIRAMVNIDSLGLGPMAVWRTHANASLFDMAVQAAGNLKMKLDVVNVDGEGDGDSSSFRVKKIPVIDFHSVRPGTFHILHSKDDTFAAVRMADYLDSFKLLANYLEYIDSHLP